MKKMQNVREGTRKGASLRKKELALALCVSLWMAGGSVAGATTVTVTDVGDTNGLGLYKYTGSFQVYYINGATDCVLNIKGGSSPSKKFAATFIAENGNVSNNTLNMTGGSVDHIYGGYVLGTGDANYNTVNLLGGSINKVYGGITEGGNAKNNTINVLAAMSLKDVYGGKNNGDGTSSENNTLNIAAKGVTMRSIQYVQNLNFYLPSTIATNDTMLTVTSATNVNGMTIGVAARQGVNLAVGDSVTLLSGTVTGTAATTTLTTDKTATGLLVDTSYKFTITQNANAITATVSDVQEEQNEERTEQAKSLVETKAATTTFVNAGADMLASQGFQQAANAVALEAAEGAKTGAGVPNVGSFTPFAAFGGSGMRAESGSYVDTRGYGLNIGFARELPNSQGKLLFGPVVEYGGGSYTSHLDDGTRGDGKAHYFGVGVMARQVNHDGFYYEGSLRGGRVTSDYDGNLEGVGRVDYDSASNYFAAHLGVGKAFDIGSDNTLDGYFKYFYSHQAGDTATIHIAGLNDETGEFDAVDSHRIRLGARLTHTINEKSKLYGGLAYQYEFGGEARAHFNGNGVPSPNVKGSSGMLELGWQVKPGDGPLTLDLGVTGWAGKQRGGSVQLGATWIF
ncbi:MAG: autotransporter outer membrane beta-barrel domain-containing protein [Schwartzia succinivorans]|nr:autotransporter outer membrane beta-barrel domain-containing protein [Schwartzia succinivorans]